MDGWSRGGRHHHPVAMHLQGYTHHCCITRRLCPPLPHPHPPTPDAVGTLTQFTSNSLSLLSVCACVRARARARSGLLEISAVDRGVISLYGVRSELFVAMNSRGRLYGTVRFFYPSPGARTHARTRTRINSTAAQQNVHASIKAR